MSGDFLKYYISNRSQFVSLSNGKSHDQKILCGIPQRSVLGPIFFNMYVNDIVYTSEILKFVLFADDTYILFSTKKYEYIENTLNTKFNKVYEWLCTNKLSINLSKTNYMIFSKTMVNHNI